MHIRVRIENGQIIPLDNISDLKDGTEFIIDPNYHWNRFLAFLRDHRSGVEPLPEYTPEHKAAILDAAERSAGIAMDDDTDMQGAIAQYRLQQAELENDRWKNDITSSTATS